MNLLESCTMADEIRDNGAYYPLNMRQLAVRELKAYLMARGGQWRDGVITLNELQTIKHHALKAIAILQGSQS